MRFRAGCCDGSLLLLLLLLPIQVLVSTATTSRRSSSSSISSSSNSNSNSNSNNHAAHSALMSVNEHALVQVHADLAVQVLLENDDEKSSLQQQQQQQQHWLNSYTAHRHWKVTVDEFRASAGATSSIEDANDWLHLERDLTLQWSIVTFAAAAASSNEQQQPQPQHFWNATALTQIVLPTRTVKQQQQQQQQHSRQSLTLVVALWETSTSTAAAAAAAATTTLLARRLAHVRGSQVTVQLQAASTVEPSDLSSLFLMEQQQQQQQQQSSYTLVYALQYGLGLVALLLFLFYPSLPPSETENENEKEYDDDDDDDEESLGYDEQDGQEGEDNGDESEVWDALLDQEQEEEEIDNDDDDVPIEGEQAWGVDLNGVNEQDRHYRDNIHNNDDDNDDDDDHNPWTFRLPRRLTDKYGSASSSSEGEEEMLSPPPRMARRHGIADSDHFLQTLERLAIQSPTIATTAPAAAATTTRPFASKAQLQQQSEEEQHDNDNDNNNNNNNNSNMVSAAHLSHSPFAGSRNVDDSPATSNVADWTTTDRLKQHSFLAPSAAPTVAAAPAATTDTTAQITLAANSTVETDLATTADIEQRESNPTTVDQLPFETAQDSRTFAADAESSLLLKEDENCGAPLSAAQSASSKNPNAAAMASAEPDSFPHSSSTDDDGTGSSATTSALATAATAAAAIGDNVPGTGADTLNMATAGASATDPTKTATKNRKQGLNLPSRSASQKSSERTADLTVPPTENADAEDQQSGAEEAASVLTAVATVDVAPRASGALAGDPLCIDPSTAAPTSGKDTDEASSTQAISGVAAVLADPFSASTTANETTDGANLAGRVAGGVTALMRRRETVSTTSSKKSDSSNTCASSADPAPETNAFPGREHERSGLDFTDSTSECADVSERVANAKSDCSTGASSTETAQRALPDTDVAVVMTGTDTSCPKQRQQVESGAPVLAVAPEDGGVSEKEVTSDTNEPSTIAVVCTAVSAGVRVSKKGAPSKLDLSLPKTTIATESLADVQPEAQTDGVPEAATATDLSVGLSATLEEQTQAGGSTAEKDCRLVKMRPSEKQRPPVVTRDRDSSLPSTTSEHSEDQLALQQQSKKNPSPKRLEFNLLGGSSVGRGAKRDRSVFDSEGASAVDDSSQESSATVEQAPLTKAQSSLTEFEEPKQKLQKTTASVSNASSVQMNGDRVGVLLDSEMGDARGNVAEHRRASPSAASKEHYKSALPTVSTGLEEHQISQQAELQVPKADAATSDPMDVDEPAFPPDTKMGDKRVNIGSRASSTNEEPGSAVCDIDYPMGHNTVASKDVNIAMDREIASLLHRTRPNEEHGPNQSAAEKDDASEIAATRPTLAPEAKNTIRRPRETNWLKNLAELQKTGRTSEKSVEKNALDSPSAGSRKSDKAATPKKSGGNESPSPDFSYVSTLPPDSLGAEEEEEYEDEDESVPPVSRTTNKPPVSGALAVEKKGAVDAKNLDEVQDKHKSSLALDVESRKSTSVKDDIDSHDERGVINDATKKSSPKAPEAEGGDEFDFDAHEERENSVAQAEDSVTHKKRSLKAASATLDGEPKNFVPQAASKSASLKATSTSKAAGGEASTDPQNPKMIVMQPSSTASTSVKPNLRKTANTTASRSLTAMAAPTATVKKKTPAAAAEKDSETSFPVNEGGGPKESQVNRAAAASSRGFGRVGDSFAADGGADSRDDDEDEDYCIMLGTGPEPLPDVPLSDRLKSAVEEHAKEEQVWTFDASAPEDALANKKKRKGVPSQIIAIKKEPRSPSSATHKTLKPDETKSKKARFDTAPPGRRKQLPRAGDAKSSVRSSKTGGKDGEHPVAKKPHEKSSRSEATGRDQSDSKKPTSKKEPAGRDQSESTKLIPSRTSKRRPREKYFKNKETVQAQTDSKEPTASRTGKRSPFRRSAKDRPAHSTKMVSVRQAGVEDFYGKDTPSASDPVTDLELSKDADVGVLAARFVGSSKIRRNKNVFGQKAQPPRVGGKKRN